MKRIILYIGLASLAWSAQAQEKLLKLDEESFSMIVEKVASSSYKDDEAQMALFEKKCKEIFDSYVKKNQVKFTEQDYRDAQEEMKRLEREIKKQENVIKRLQKDSADRADDALTKEHLLDVQKQWRRDSIELQRQLVAFPELKERVKSDSMLLVTKEDLITTLNLEKQRGIRQRDSLLNLYIQQKEELENFHDIVDKMKEKMEKACEESQNSSLLALNDEKLQAEGNAYESVRFLIGRLNTNLDKKLSCESQQLLEIARISILARKAVEGMKEPYSSDKNRAMQTEMGKLELTCLTPVQKDEYHLIFNAVKEQYRSYKNIKGILNDLKEKKCIPTEEKAEEALANIRGYLAFVTEGETYDPYYGTFNEVLQTLIHTLQQGNRDILSDEDKFLPFLEELEKKL